MLTQISRVRDIFHDTRIVVVGVILTTTCHFPVAFAATSSQTFGTSIDYTMHRLATEYNDPSAQYLVGRNYLKGKSVEKNISEAIKWFEMAAKQNHVRAQYQLGKIYLYGIDGVKPNVNYAFYFLSKAAESNHIDSQYELGNYYLRITPKHPKYDKAIRWFKQAAARDHVRSMYKLGKLTYEGKGLPADPEEGIRLLNLAAENGLLEATHYINQIEISNPEHIALINSSPNRNSPSKQLDQFDIGILTDSMSNGALNDNEQDPVEYYRLGIKYLTGDKSEKQFEKSAFYFRKAAEKNHGKAQYQLAKLYKQGIGVEQSEQLYRDWLEKAASAGVLSATREWESLQLKETSPTPSANRQDPGELYVLGLKYLTGNGVAKDPVKASQLFMDAAMKEHPRSQYQLGIMYIDGTGLSPDKDKAKKWLTKAAEAGLVDARYVLNSLTPQQKYQAVTAPVSQNTKASLVEENIDKPLFSSVDSTQSRLISEAENGDPEAQHELGMKLLKGLDGYEKDTERAIFWLEKAAENGIADSQFQLGNLYKRGIGVDRNNSTAVMWFRKAANQGHKEARKRLGGCRIC